MKFKRLTKKEFEGARHGFEKSILTIDYLKADTYVSSGNWAAAMAIYTRYHDFERVQDTLLNQHMKELPDIDGCHLRALDEKRRILVALQENLERWYAASNKPYGEKE